MHFLIWTQKVQKIQKDPLESLAFKTSKVKVPQRSLMLIKILHPIVDTYLRLPKGPTGGPDAMVTNQAKVLQRFLGAHRAFEYLLNMDISMSPPGKSNVFSFPSYRRYPIESFSYSFSRAVHRLISLLKRTTDRVSVQSK